MSKYLKLPVKFSNTDVEVIEQFEELGMEPPQGELEEGVIYVNPDHITFFNEDSKGNVQIITSDGFHHMIFMEFKEFLKIVNDD